MKINIILRNCLCILKIKLSIWLVFIGLMELENILINKMLF